MLAQSRNREEVPGKEERKEKEDCSAKTAGREKTRREEEAAGVKTLTAPGWELWKHAPFGAGRRPAEHAT